LDPPTSRVDARGRPLRSRELSLLVVLRVPLGETVLGQFEVHEALAEVDLADHRPRAISNCVVVHL